MRISFVGLGKLGLPCAVAAAMRGHDVMGYDIIPALMNKDPRSYKEAGLDGTTFNDLLKRSTIRFGGLKEVMAHAEIMFVAVQTPHKKEYEGVTRVPNDRVDFNYKYLTEAIEAISACAQRETIVAIVSTVLPGTVRRFVKPIAAPLLQLCYNPAFIAMGTTMQDFLDPEFVLLGVTDAEAATKVEAFYASITAAPTIRMSIDSAELAKVAYNTFIGMKIVFANTLMEICHKTPGTNVDDVAKALKKSHRRLLSPAYLEGGMGDGGGCHPRDNIALSWLARELNLSRDIFDDLMEARFKQTEWLADLMIAHDLPKAIMGYSFKAESNLTVGSPALLLKSVLEERGFQPFMYDPYIDGVRLDFLKLPPHVFLIGTKHQQLKSLAFPKGSVVIDPWRYMQPQDGVLLVPLGVGPQA